MKAKVLGIFFLVCFLFTCCTPKVYFTKDIRNRIESANISLNNIQYYNDRKVILRRELESGYTKVQSGKVKLENGRYINYIILGSKTPGICTNSFTDKLNIAFESGQGTSLTFGLSPETGNFSRYQIFALQWTGQIGKIEYDGETYYIQQKGSGAQLMIKKKVLNKIDVEKRRMKGVRIE